MTWSVYLNNGNKIIQHNNQRVAMLNAQNNFIRFSSVRIPIRILEHIGAPQRYIDEVRAEDIRHNANRTHRIIPTIIENGFDMNRTFGVEIECVHNSNEYIKEDIVEALAKENIPCEIVGYTHQVMDHWKITTDGSLNGEYTMELVSPVLKGQDGFNQIKKVLKVLNNLDVEVNRSCGMHVHHYAKDLGRSFIKKCYETYLANESLIDAFMPMSRRSNYCRWAQTLNAVSFKDFYKNHGANGRNDYRYFKLNAQCYYVYGTIEFRQHSGTIDFKKIINWIKFTQALLLRGNNQNYNNIQDMITALKVNDNNYFTERTAHFSS